jgi:hypothetical protein
MKVMRHAAFAVSPRIHAGVCVGACAALLAVAIAATTLSAFAASGDPRPLNASESATFLPLVCSGPSVDKNDDHHCKKLLARSSGDNVQFDLMSIAYGPFTKTGTDEAYVTYGSIDEAHVNNFGGGILFARDGGKWRLAKWFMGKLMEECVRVPGGSTVRMLCYGGYSNMGEGDAWIDVMSLKSGAPESYTIVRAEHTLDSGLPWRPNGCKGGTGGKAMLLDLEVPKPSSADGAFATSSVTYETAANYAKRCTGGALHATHGVVKFRNDGGTVKAVTPVPFIEPWIEKNG